MAGLCRAIKPGRTIGYYFMDFQATTMNPDHARENMIEQQVRAWEVLDETVLGVLRSVPREAFVPEAYRALAFADTEIPIGHDETMMRPTVEGRMLQALELTGSEHVLEIGTGSGFVTACLARLGKHVMSVDIHGDFVGQAADRLAKNDIDNVKLEQMDAMQALPEERFDAIAVTGSVPDFDPRFVDALTEGGRLFIVVGKPPIMEARLVTRSGDNEWRHEALFETLLKPLVNASAGPEFSF